LIQRVAVAARVRVDGMQPRRPGIEVDSRAAHRPDGRRVSFQIDRHQARDTALRLRALGVRAIDVGGVGGTSFAAIEGYRAAQRGDVARAQLGASFREWGIPSAVSVAGCVTSRLPVIATGGVRSGLDAAKALALGATAVGVGRPLLQAALDGEAAVDAWVAQFELELRTATFLAGVARSRDLGRRPIVVTGTTGQWLDQLGYRPRRRVAGPSRS